MARMTGDRGDPQEIMGRAIVGCDALHPLLQTSVYSQFVSGAYGAAIRDAFLIVEERVKATSGLKGEVGVALMRAAFNPIGGPNTLTDMTQPAAEREKMVDLFVGAIATFKNPVSQKVLGNGSSPSTFEALRFASQLLSYLP